MTDTTIRLTQETKQALDEQKQPGESYNDTVRRLADAGYGRAWTENEIRELIRDELQQIQGGVR